MKKIFVLVALFALTILFSACGGGGETPAQNVAPAPLQVSAHLAPTEGNSVYGNVTFSQEGNDSVRIIAEVSGLTPGSHGFHIHENGDCSAPDASSAGGHFNPLQTQHGKAGEGDHHAGDLPSLEADGEGSARINAVLNGITLTGDHSIVGRSLIVHADPDDFTTQPTGNAGARVACAVIHPH